MNNESRSGVSSASEAARPQRLREAVQRSPAELRCVHRWIEMQAGRNPEAVALTGPGETLTYGQLNARANRLARRLRGWGVGPEVLVGVCAGRSPALVVGLLAAFQVLLHRYSGQADIAVGTPVAGRTRLELEDLIGFFVNTLVMRVDLAGDPGFRVLLGRVRRVAIEAYTHQELPFEKLVSVVQAGRDAGRTSLFQAMFALQNAPLPALRTSELVLTPLEVDSGTSKFDLSLFAEEWEEGLKLTLEYSADLFEVATVDRMLAHYRILLEDIVAHPDQPIGMLAMLTAEELRSMLMGRGASEVDAFAERFEGAADGDLDFLLNEHA